MKYLKTKPPQFLNFIADEKGDTLRPFLLYGDNKGAVFTSGNPDVSKNSKHLEVKYYKIREYIGQGLLTVRYCETTRNLADFFTKALDRTKFAGFKKTIMNSSVPMSSDSVLFIRGRRGQHSPRRFRQYEVSESSYVLCDDLIY